LPDEFGQRNHHISPALMKTLKIHSHQFSVALLTLGLCGCVGTSLDQNLKSPSYHGGAVQKVAVVAVDERVLIRQGFENRFARQMVEHGQSAIVTYDLLSLPEIKADKQAATARFHQAGADSVLVIRLANQSTRATQTQATANIFVPVVAGYGYNDWYDYYSVSFVNMGTAWGDSKTEVYLETSLYDLKTSQRIWAGGTVTVLKEGTDRVAQMDPIVSKVLAALRKDGLVR
jgi:hypothetical protein